MQSQQGEPSLKLAVAGGLFVLGFAGCLAPRYTFVMSQHCFSLGNMLASGVLLGGGLLHQLPDAQEVLHTKGAFPWASFICGCAFTAFLILEETMHLLLHDHDHDQSSRETVTHIKWCQH